MIICYGRIVISKVEKMVSLHRCAICRDSFRRTLCNMCPRCYFSFIVAFATLALCVLGIATSTKKETLVQVEGDHLDVMAGPVGPPGMTNDMLLPGEPGLCYLHSPPPPETTHIHGDSIVSGTMTPPPPLPPVNKR